MTASQWLGLIQKKQITAGGRRQYVVGLLVAMAVLAILLVPLTVVILNHVFDRAALIGPAKVSKIMLMTVLAPLVVGAIILIYLVVSTIVSVPYQKWRAHGADAAPVIKPVGRGRA